MASVAVFDINETTLDLAPVRIVVDRLVGAEGGFRAWFARLLQLSMTVTATGQYAEFSTLAASALEAVAATGRTTLPEGTIDELAEAMSSLEPYPDVVAGLTLVREAGWTTMTLTNGAQSAVEAQLRNAGLADLFDHVLSVGAVRAFKPAPEPYRHAADVAGVAPSAMTMVACHDWDLAGARAVDMSTAYVRRPGVSYASALPGPDLAVDDFVDLAAHLITQN